MLWQLWRGTRPMGGSPPPTRACAGPRPRIALACLIMGVALLVGARLLAGPLADPLHRYGALALLVALGLASYTAAAFATGGLRAADLRAAMRRG